VKFTLPLTEQEVEIRDFMPHGVNAKVQEAMFSGVNIGSQVISPSKEDLLNEFGADVMKELDSLPEPEYKKRLDSLRVDFVRRNMKLDGIGIRNAENANAARIEGMVLLVDGKKPESGWADELPEADYQTLLSEIGKVENVEGKKKLPKQSKASSTAST
jgi:hypothetical protein